VEQVDWPVSGIVKSIFLWVENRDIMIIMLGRKKCVNFFKLRHNIYMCILICMTKHSQILYDLDGAPQVLP
jgi:hypothetical protein